MQKGGCYAKAIFTIHSIFSYFFVITAGCGKSSIELSDPVPSSIKEYKSISASQIAIKKFKETGIYINEGSLFTVLMDDKLERSCLSGRMGGQMVPLYQYFLKAPVSEQLQIGRSGTCHDTINVRGLIIVWSEEDYGKIANVLDELKNRYPNNEDILAALDLAKSL